MSPRLQRTPPPTLASSQALTLARARRPALGLSRRRSRAPWAGVREGVSQGFLCTALSNVVCFTPAVSLIYDAAMQSLRVRRLCIGLSS